MKMKPLLKAWAFVSIITLTPILIGMILAGAIGLLIGTTIACAEVWGSMFLYERETRKFLFGDKPMKTEPWEKEKNREEVSLIVDFEMEYGMADNWDEETAEKFDNKWDEIQQKWDEIQQKYRSMYEYVNL